MPKAMRDPIRQIPETPIDKLKLGERLAKIQDETGEASFSRYLREMAGTLAGVSPETLRRWTGNSRALASAVPYGVAREALLEVTRGRGLFSTEGGPRLSNQYAGGLRKHPVPPAGTSYDDCRDWALEVLVAAEKHINLRAAPESWQIQSAKARFSEVFRRARSEGPQRITRQGKEGVVMVAQEQYDQLVGKSHQPTNIVQFFRQSPLVGVDLDLERDPDPGRDTDLT
jgi:antitoxin Phd